jgi:hypothetical protein
MKLLILFFFFSFLGTVGCRRETHDKPPESTLGGFTKSSPGNSSDASVRQNNAEIVNAFGMEFVRIEIDPDLNIESDPPFPAKTYYIQKDEISSVHLTSFQSFVKNRNIEPNALDVRMMSSINSPCEWRDYSNLAAVMSEYDPVYDYRLPTKSEWVFACMSGYEQHCTTELNSKDRPNKYGIVDMLDGDVECVAQVGLLMGNWINSWPGTYDGHEKPACACKWWTMCNPDADDGLNEMIYGRFILVQENGNRPDRP